MSKTLAAAVPTRLHFWASKLQAGIATVPEPSSRAFLSVGLLLVGALARKRQR